MSGFDILSLVGEPWAEANNVFRGIGVTVTDTASHPTSKFLEFVLNGASIYAVLKSGETIISNAAGTSLGGIKLAGGAGEMALTSQIDLATGLPAEALRYAWEDPAHVGSDATSGSVLQGMGARNFSIEGAGAITHIAGSSAYAWAGMLGSRLLWSGYTAATNNGKTIDFTNVGQTSRASPILSVSANNVADDLVHFGLSDGTNWTIAAKIDAAGRGQFQMLDLPAQGAPGDPAVDTVRVYGKDIGGVTRLAFRDSAGGETVVGTSISVAGGVVTANSPIATFSQTWNESSVPFSAITANITDQNSRVDSNLLDLEVNSGSVFQVRKTGETVISNAAGTSIGGIKLAGNAGEMALTSQVNPETGTPADVLRYYWEGMVGQVAVLRGMGTNRLSIESNGAIVQIAQNSRFEFEGLGNDRLIFAGFEAASASGKTFDFNNSGQNPTRASPVVSISTDVNFPEDDPLHITTFDGQGWTVRARFDGTGRLHGPGMESFAASGAAPGFAARLDTDTEVRAAIGIDSSDRGVIRLGVGETTAPDVTLARDIIPGALRISNDSGSAQIRIYRLYANNGIDTEFWHLSWLATTTTPWASIRTAGTGIGSKKNLCIETPLIGIGTPAGDASNIPALKRNGVQLQVRLGDDSDFAAIRGKLTTADDAVEETIVPDKTLTLYDASGIAYKVACVAA